MKRRIMRIISMLMAFVMTLAMSVTGFAEPDPSDQIKYTITVKNSIGGITYNVYKVFDVTYSTNTESEAYVYTIDSARNPWFEKMYEVDDCPFDLTLQAGSQTVYVVTVKEEYKETAQEVITKWFNNPENIPENLAPAVAGQTGTGKDIVFYPEEAGYYLVVPSALDMDSLAISLTTAAPDGEIVDKNQKPGEGGGDKNLSKGANSESYSIGDEVIYTITSYVPTYDGDELVADYTLTDTMGAGLDLQVETEDGKATSGLKVEISGGSPVATTDITDKCTVTVEKDGKNTVLTITWNVLELADYPADAVVHVTYTALVNEQADETNMNNTVALKWHLASSPEGPEVEDEDKPEVHVYTYGFTLQKKNGEDSKAIFLDGAVFTLKEYGGDNPASDIYFVYDKNSNTYEVVADEESAAATKEITVNDGQINIWGLGAGTYTLTEIKAPDGYNMLNAPLQIVIETVMGQDDDGNEIVTGWIVTVNEQPYYGYFEFENVETDKYGVAVMPTITVVNSTGALLPGTGGIGTTIFYIVGTILVLAAAALVVTKWRLGRND